MEKLQNEHQLRELIRILERKLGVLEDAGISCCGVTFAQCHAMVEIGRSGTISLVDLAEQLNLDNSTLSRTVNNMVNSSLVEREIDPADRRYISIKLTDKGREMYEGLEDSMTSYFRSIYESIPDNKKQQVLESLQLLLDAIADSKCCEN